MTQSSAHYIAHRRKDGLEQPLINHLNEVGEIAAQFATKFRVSDAGKLLGLLHDFGKFSKNFQDYIGSATGKIYPDEDDFVDYRGLKGKIDHSTAGAQWLWQACQKSGSKQQLVGQVLSICIVSHHSGLIDCLKPNGENSFQRRMAKPDHNTHKNESRANAPQEYLKKLDALLSRDLIASVANQLRQMMRARGAYLPFSIQCFNFGFLTRMLFSCLIDADRINSADFEYPDNTRHRGRTPPDWNIAVDRIEEYIRGLADTTPIDHLRRDVSNTCKTRSLDPQSIYTLTVPTGGGKTYASLRYALHHARHHQLDRIIYVIPFTSIIDQNAQALRKAIENKSDVHPWILELHSNLEPEQQTWHSKLVSENWDAPIIMTTMVQFLEVLFSGGTRGARKMHQLAKSVLIFDEIQTLPLNCTYLFCNALNFLTNYCETTAVLCTATQPLLNKLKDPKKGQLNIPPENELVSDVPQLFKDLRRVRVKNQVRPEGWTEEQITQLALDEFKKSSSCLIIVNTKAWAQAIYEKLLTDLPETELFLLSTNLCPKHRKTVLETIKQRLNSEPKRPVLCVSTQLIEAGVDVDFSSVIRFLAGLDSIAQAAGRCNRNGSRDEGFVYVVNPRDENITMLKDIKVGRDIAQRVFDEGHEDILAPEAIAQYFKYYFYDRASEMAYPTSSEEHERDDDLLNLLSENKRNIGRKPGSALLQQSFMSAGKIFKAIDSPTHGVVVPYNDESTKLIAELCAVAKDFDMRRYRELLRQAQQFSVNVFPNVWRRLRTEGAVYETQPDEGIYCLREEYYSDKFGLSDKPCKPMELLNA